MQQEPYIRTPSVELPIFQGVNASAWITECEGIFDLAGIHQENKVKWANAHIRGKAKTWLHSCHFDLSLMNWPQFCALLCERFPSPGAEESMELCQQLKQVNTVDHYIDQFEDWMTAMRKDHPYLPEGFFLLRFICGLKETIKHDIQCHKPPTLRAAYWFARKQEMSYLSNNKKQHALPAKPTATQIAPKQFPVKESRPRNF
jgi:hypothetical protein